MKTTKILAAFFVLGLIFAQDRPVSTYSIVAIDKESGEMGGAVQSHWFSVGSLVLWAEPGVGIVATQSFVRPEYGPELLKLFATSSASPRFVLESLLKKDSEQNVRQVGAVNTEVNLFLLQEKTVFLMRLASRETVMRYKQTLWQTQVCQKPWKKHIYRRKVL